MSFMDGIPRTVTEKDLTLSWSGGKNGKYFRCRMCGYKFRLDDIFRFVYTNNLSGYGGNPIVCEQCDGDDVIDRWKKMCDEYKNIEHKYWWFIGDSEG